MVIIADSGSTKTSWAILGLDKPSYFQTSGFNPYTQTNEQVCETIENEVLANTRNLQIETIYFYGAGCSIPENKRLIHDCFHRYFNKSHIEVEHDLLAAARALWANEPGIVAILGTGSNSCVYNGVDIVEAVPSLGFILGDEGSGADMGKRLLCGFLYGTMPKNMMDAFWSKYNLNTEKALDHIYKKPNPNRWLASFAGFIADNIEDPYCNELVLSCLEDFFEYHIICYDNQLPLGVIGSIGYYFRPQVEIISARHDYELKKVVKSPMDGLVEYHESHKQL